MEQYYRQFENCLQEEKPFCTDRCPFQVDVLDFMDKMGRKRYNAAYKILRNAMVFPEIVTALCPQYCTAECPRKQTDGAVQINLLEKTCLARAKRKDPNEYNLPPKQGKAAIVGAGISGLACALRLMSKKYEVTVFERSDRLGGKLWELLPEDVFLEDIQRQMKYENYTLNLNSEVNDIEELCRQGFDAVYIATGAEGTDFDLFPDGGKPCMKIGETAVFAGGSLLGKEPMYALKDGIDMAWAIEVYFKTKKVEYPEESLSSKVVADLSRIRKAEPVLPSDDGVFTEEEMTAEIERCIRCQCNGCRTHCDLTDYFDKWPLQMRDEIMTTTMSSDSLVHKRPAMQMINSCTQCRLCDEICPGKIELGAMIKEARKKLHQLDRTPGAYHQFWLRDMEFANGKFAAVKKLPPGKASCKYAFFPGCHLGAADPRYVLESYRWLLSADADTGLLLRCCGVPADWSGNEQLHREEIDGLRADWEALGKPVLIMACPSCMRHFWEYLPEIEIVSLYEKMADAPDGRILPGAGAEQDSSKEIYSIFDPCAARLDDDLQDAVRRLAAAAGISAEELPNAARNGCCGFGGMIGEAMPGMAEQIAQKRSSLSDRPYVTYCSNCRDVFLDEGKPANHILDLVFDLSQETDERPDVTQRRWNRVKLKDTLLREFWDEEMMEKPEKTLELIIGSEVREKMNRLRILEEDICEVLEYCGRINRRTLSRETDTYRCYKEIGHITCWVEYRMAGEAFEILNVFTHRMKIELEAMWNGKKADFDL